MSLSIIKFNEDQLYNVANVKIKTSRGHHAYRPCSRPHCDEIMLTVVSAGENAGFLLNWYINNDPKDFELFVNTHGTDYTDCDRHFTLEEAYCFSIEEVYDNTYSRRHLIQLGIMVGTQTLNEMNTKNYIIKSY